MSLSAKEIVKEIDVLESKVKKLQRMTKKTVLLSISFQNKILDIKKQQQQLYTLLKEKSKSE